MAVFSAFLRLFVPRYHCFCWLGCSEKKEKTATENERQSPTALQDITGTAVQFPIRESTPNLSLPCVRGGDSAAARGIVNKRTIPQSSHMRRQLPLHKGAFCFVPPLCKGRWALRSKARRGCKIKFLLRYHI